MSSQCSGPNLVIAIFLTSTTYHRSQSRTGVVGGQVMKALVVLLGLITATLLPGNWGVGRR